MPDGLVRSHYLAYCGHPSGIRELLRIKCCEMMMEHEMIFCFFFVCVQEHSPQGLSVPRRVLRDGCQFVLLQFGVLYVCRCCGFASHSLHRNSDVDNNSNASASCSSFLLSSQHRLFQEPDLGEYIVKINHLVDQNLEQRVL